jgi:hypothetical protein
LMVEDQSGVRKARVSVRARSDAPTVSSKAFLSHTHTTSCRSTCTPACNSTIRLLHLRGDAWLNLM